MLGLMSSDSDTDDENEGFRRRRDFKDRINFAVTHDPTFKEK